jgi:hypothetical protein
MCGWASPIARAVFSLLLRRHLAEQVAGLLDLRAEQQKQPRNYRPASYAKA